MSTPFAKIPLPHMTDKPLTTRHTDLVQIDVSEWELATAKQRTVVRDRMLILDYVIAETEKGLTNNLAVATILRKCEAGQLPENITDKARGLGRKGQFVSSGSLRGWLKKFQDGGREALLSGNKGRTRIDYGWEAEAMAMFNIPSKPAYQAVAKKLRRLGFDCATDSRVTAYLKSLPATLGKDSPHRIGKHEYHLTRKPSRHRDTTVLQVGELYQGDGHTVDVYLADPNTGNPYRPELTVWMDIRSRYITGWYLSEAESSLSTLFSLSHALVSHDHVPAWLHIDHGSGFKAKMMSDESTGYYARFDISTMFSIPGNPRGKGQVERWFRTLRDQHDKFWNGGKDYCGHDMAAEANRRITTEIKQGKRKLLSVEQYKDDLREYIDSYHNEVHSTLNGKTPAEIWATLNKVPVEMTAEAIMRPRTTALVRKFSVRLHNRHYRSGVLKHYDGSKVTVEYDLHNDNEVTILDSDERMICIAQLTAKQAYMPESRLIEARQKRLDGQIKRQQRHIEEKKQRAQVPLTNINTKHLSNISDYQLNSALDPSADLDLSLMNKAEESESDDILNINILDFDDEE